MKTVIIILIAIILLSCEDSNTFHSNCMVTYSGLMEREDAFKITETEITHYNPRTFEVYQHWEIKSKSERPIIYQKGDSHTYKCDAKYDHYDYTIRIIRYGHKITEMEINGMTHIKYFAKLSEGRKYKQHDN